MSKCWIGLIGSNGSGKSAASTYISNKGFHIVSLSDMVRHQATDDGLPLDRETLIQTANRMKDLWGADVLAKKAVEMALSYGDKVVFDSIRHPIEVTILSSYGVRCVGIDAPVEVRFSRIQSRKRETDHVDFKTFLDQDSREYWGKSSGQSIHEALRQCEFMIDNQGDLAEFYHKLDLILEAVS